jgi:PAS domain S-box-containing protein
VELTDALLAGLLRSMGDGVIVADPQGDIAYWNDGAQRLFGWSSDEAVGQPLEIIIPERLRARHNEGYAKTMATGITKYGTDLLKVPAVNRAGERLSIAFTVALLYPEGVHEGPPLGIAAVLRDETERWNEDREVRRRLADLEQQAAAGSS